MNCTLSYSVDPFSGRKSIVGNLIMCPMFSFLRYDDGTNPISTAGKDLVACQISLVHI